MPSWITLQYVEPDSDASTFPPPYQDCFNQALGDTLPTVARFHINRMHVQNPLRLEYRFGLSDAGLNKPNGFGLGIT